MANERAGGWEEEDAAIRKAAKAAYMREYRKKNPEKMRSLDKVLGTRKKAKDPGKFNAAAKDRVRKYRERKRAKMTPEERERLNAANRERNRKYRDKDRAAYRKKRAKQARERYAKDPTKMWDIVHRRRTVLDAGSVPLAEWKAIVARYGDRCAYCRAAGVPMTMDHVKPLSKGGAHSPANVVPACRPCNTRKNNREWPQPEPPEQ